MTQSFTINREQSLPILRRLADIPGVRHVVVLDAAGLCLAHTGHEPVAAALITDWTVVAHAAFAACDDMGQRCGAGPCQEALQTHRDGGTLMRSLAGGMMLLVQFDSRAPAGTVRLVAAEVAMDLPVPVAHKAPPRPQRPAHADPFVGMDAPSRAPVMSRHQSAVIVDA